MAQQIAAHNPGGYGGSTRAVYGQNPFAVTLGYGGGPGGEGITAGESGTGEAPTSGPKMLEWDGGATPPPLAADAKGAPTWRDQMKLDEGQLTGLNHQYDHISSQLQREFDPAKKAALESQLSAVHGQRTSLESRIYSPTSLEDYQAGSREQRSQQDVARSSAVMHQPVQLKPGDVSQSGHVYQAAEDEVNQASAHVQQPVQVQPGQPSQSGHPYQPANVAAQVQSDLHGHLEKMGVPQAPAPGALLDANQAAAIKQAAGGNPDAAARLALSLGYNIKQMKPAAQEAPAPPK